MIYLSKDFTLEEFIKSPTATRLGFIEQFNPPEGVVFCLTALVEKVVQPLRDELGHPLTITSGYRCERLNKQIGGVPTSQHVKGQAVDIEDSTIGNEALFEHIRNSRLPFDQLINEFGGKWIHVSFNPYGNNRRQVLKAIKNSNNETVYVPAS